MTIREGVPRQWLNQLLTWRVALVRVVVDVLAVAVVVVVAPGVSIAPEDTWLQVLFLGLLYAALNLFVRPLLYLVLLPFVVQSYGTVMIGVYVIQFALLAWLSGLIAVSSPLTLLLAGVLLGLLTWGLEGALGLTRPVITDDGAPERPEAAA